MRHCQKYLSRSILFFLIIGLASCNPPQTDVESQNNRKVQTSQTMTEKEEYKGVHFGTNFDTFANSKQFSKKHCNSCSYKYDIFFKSVLNYDVSNNYIIAVILGAPIYKSIDMFGSECLYVKTETIPKNICSAYVEGDDIYYIFYNGKFAMAFSELVADNYSHYYDFFSKNYNLVTTIQETFSEPMTGGVKFNAVMFQKNNMGVYLIKGVYLIEQRGDKPFVSVLYIHNNYYKLIKNEIGKNLVGEEEEERKKKEREIDKLK